MLLSDAADGFFLTKEVAGLSPNTLYEYRLRIESFIEFVGDVRVEEVDERHVREFLRDMQRAEDVEVEDGLGLRGTLSSYSDSTIANAYTALSSLWTWLTDEGHAERHVVRRVDRPPLRTPEVVPFTKDEIAALVAEAARNQFSYVRYRDPALILFLLDTGVRASELCRLNVGHVDMDAQTARVLGKGWKIRGEGKERAVAFGVRTRKRLWRFLAEREDVSETAPLFATMHGGRMERRSLTTHLKNVGKRAGVDNVYTHRFRHTFAINYLRNQGDIFTLQRLLGHSSLNMVRRYLNIAKDDAVNAHRRASPVDNWKL